MHRHRYTGTAHSVALLGALALSCDTAQEPGAGVEPPPHTPPDHPQAPAPAQPQAAAKEATPAPAPLDAAVIGTAVGTAATTTPDGTVRVSWPRDEVSVTIDGVAFPVAAGLTSWAGFAPLDGGAMLMGDTVVFRDEVDAAMDAAFAHGLEVTALHNHFFFDEPKVYFMHIGGHGAANALAGGVHAVWGAIREVRARRAQPADGYAGPTPQPGGALDATAIGEVIGEKASVKGDDVVKVSVAREASMHGHGFAGSMGLTTWAAFTGNDALASVDGDFAMTAGEVQPVLRALRGAGLHVVALHNHMIGEEPAYYFTHFWGKGPVTDLARAFRAGLNAQRQTSRE